MERRLESGTGDARKIKSAAAALAETLPEAARARRRRRARRAADRDRRARRRSRRRPTGPSATSTAPRRPPARRRWPPRPRSWPRTRPSGRPQATGCARSSRSGGRSAGWTARPTMRCGSGTRRPGRPSTGAAARISPSSTATGPARGRPRRRCANAPRSCPTPPTGAPPARRSATCWPSGRPRAARPRTSTTRCGSGSRPRRTRSSPPATPSAPSATPSSGPTPTPRRRCSPRPRRSTPPISTPRGPRCARSATSGTRSARCRASGAPTWSDGCAPSRRRCATRRSGRRRSGSAGPGRPIPRSRRAIRAAGGEGRGGRADQGRRGGAGQRRTVASVGRRGSRGARQEGLGLLRPRRVVVAAVVVEAVQQALGLTFGDCLRRSSSAASCSAVRAHTARAQLKASTITASHAMIRPMPGPGWCAGAVCRDHTASRPVKDATVDPASAIHASAQRRVSSASIEKPTPNTSASQVNTRDGNAMPSRIAASLPASTSQPLASPVCGSTNVSSSTNTAMAITNALAPGSISRATRRSAASMSPLNSSKSAVVPIACGHRAHPDEVGCGAGAPMPGMPRPTPRAGLACPAAWASPALVRRWVVRAAVGDQVVRRGAGDGGGDDVAGPDVEARRVEVHQPAVAGASGHACGAGVLAAFAGGHQQLDGAPDLRGVLLQRDAFLQVDQPLIAFLHNGFRQLPVQLGGRRAGALGVLEGERAARTAPARPRRAWPGSPPRSRRGTRR